MYGHRVTWWCRLAALFVVVAAVVYPQRASAATAVQLETRIRGIELGVHVLVRGSSAPTPEKHLGSSAAYDEMEPGYSLAAEGGGGSTSPTINPADIAGKTPQEIDQIARSAGLTPKGLNPMGGKGAYVDPVTGEQRVLIHPEGPSPHAHVNDPAGARLGPNGPLVPPESPGAHLPIKTVP